MMSSKLRVKNPLYPLVGVGASFLILLLGLALSGRPVIFAAYLVALCLLYLVFGYGVILAMCLALFIPLGAFTGAISILVAHDWHTALSTLGRVVLLGLSVILLITTPPVNLTRCMTRIGLPRFLTLGLLVSIRFVPILLNETRRIREAMRTRGVKMAWYNVSHVYRSFLIPFVMQLINLSDMLAVSVETRAFSLTDTNVTIYKKLLFSTRDGLFTATLVLVSAMGALGAMLV